MKTEKDFYLSDIREIERDLYRNGNSSFPKFTNKDGNIRPQDSKLLTDPKTGIVYVLPSHAGVSANEIFDGGTNRWKINRSEEHTSELQSRPHLVCRLLLEKKK